jgi:hypothetical protein
VLRKVYVTQNADGSWLIEVGSLSYRVGTHFEAKQLLKAYKGYTIIIFGGVK